MTTESLGEPNERARFMQEHLPMDENSWPGTTLAYHVLNAVREQAGDEDFTSRLADAFIGVEAAIFHLDDDLTEELGLHVAKLVINEDHIIVQYEGDDAEHVILPHGSDTGGVTATHRFTITTGRESTWEETRGN